MPRFRALQVAGIAVVLPFVAAAQAPPPPPAFSWYPPQPSQGSLIRLTVQWPGVVKLRGSLAGEMIHFERDTADTFHAVGAVPLNADRSLSGFLWADESPDSVAVSLPVAVRTVRSERLRTAPQYTAPPDSALARRIAVERAQIREVFARAHQEPRLWSLWFSPPRRSPVTSAFGTRRTFNGATLSRHLGLDYDGVIGDPVVAANRGVVALVGDFFYGGTSVYISHGTGLVTAYLHLSAVHVAVGDRVERGQLIGSVGATGRVTGPHLHWSVNYGRLSVDPMTLLGLRPLPTAPAGVGKPGSVPPIDPSR